MNDTFGHPGGDTILVAAADVLRRVARAEDVPARLGGDEFAILMPPCDAADDLDMPCTVSIGISSSETTDRLSIMARADDALYRSKAHRLKGAEAQAVSAHR